MLKLLKWVIATNHRVLIRGRLADENLRRCSNRSRGQSLQDHESRTAGSPASKKSEEMGSLPQGPAGTLGPVLAS